jgi:adenosine deaminase
VTADDFFDLAYAYLTRAASEGVRHAEMFFDPQAHTAAWLSTTRRDTYLEVLDRYASDHGVAPSS